MFHTQKGYTALCIVSILGDIVNVAFPDDSCCQEACGKYTSNDFEIDTVDKFAALVACVRF